MGKCQYRGCDKDLSPGRRKYCSDFCRYWENQCKKDSRGTGKPFSVAQHLRMVRAAREQWKSDVRYN